MPPSTNDLTTWALPRLKRLLPLDDASLGEIITYTATLPESAAAEHLQNLLGDSPGALEFIASFNARRKGHASSPAVAQAIDQDHDDGHVPRNVKGAAKRGGGRAKAPLHSAGPARVPAGYGDVAGGYSKKYDGDSSNAFAAASTGGASASASGSGTRTPDALQLPKVSNGGSRPRSLVSSRDVSPARAGTTAKTKNGPSQQGTGKLPPSASGNLISDFGFANVRSKQAKKPHHSATTATTTSQPHSGTSTPQSGGKNTAGTPTTTTTSSISDLTAAIAALELSTNPSLSSHRRKCPCNASIHPLFSTAPNCLNCGKIICALEGLQPCSFCDAPILTKDQVQDMIRALKEERGIEKMVAHNVGQQQQSSHSGRGTPTFLSGSGTPADSGDEAIARATAHRDKLLAFQRENAQRTRIHDEAMDYDATLTTGATQWMTPVQRAAALKKQQKYLREMEEENKPEWEKKRTVLSVGIKNGKLVRTYERAPREREKDKDKDNDEEGDEGEDMVDGADQNGGGHAALSTRHGGKGAFSDNPLLVTGKLIRPIWKPSLGDDDGKGKGVDVKDSQRQRKSVWRRVQDDNDGYPGEHYVLDGGLHGFRVEDRMMEDGSQQECG